MIENIPVAIRFLATTGCFLVFLFFLTPRQVKEVLLPEDGLTRLRWYLLSVLLVIIITLIPSMVSQFFQAIGYDYRILKNISAIVGAVNLVSLTVLFIMIYIYRRND